LEEVCLKARTPKEKRVRPKLVEDLSVPVWVDPHLSPAFYKRLAAVASTCNVPRYQVLKDGVELFLRNYEEQRGLITKVSKDKNTAKQIRDSLSKISKGYWETLTDEQKRERGQKAAQARWAKQKRQSDS
jgi:hypothetical protein